MAKIKLSPRQSIEYYEDGRLVAKITPENIEDLSPIVRDYIAFIHPYDNQGMFTIPIIGSGQEEFKIAGEILEREKQGNTLVFRLRNSENKKKEIRIIYNGIDLDNMLKTEDEKVRNTGWRKMLGKEYSFPEP